MDAAATIAGRLAAVRAAMAEACARSGRTADAVTLVLASKTQPAAAIAAAYAAGARDFGENYVQEGLAKQAATVGLAGLRWHLIGHLQSNKARAVVGSFALLHTLDSARLAAALARVRAEPPQDVLIEVNLGGETTKDGVAPAATEALIETVRARVAVRGLMAIPPPERTEAVARRWFGALRELRDRLAARTGLALSELSMGMSDDYAAAIAEGATIVRVGRAVFGARNG